MSINTLQLSDVVKVSEAWSTEVELRRDYTNASTNEYKLRGYVPNSASRKALVGICEGLSPGSSKRAHLVTGPRGTGKSHFALVLANFVRRNPDDEAMQPFWEKLRADEEAYELARRARENTHPYLVVIPNPAGDPYGVDHALQVALNEALQRERVSFRPSSVYSAAVNKINYWKQNDPEAYQKLQSELRRLDWDVDAIQRRLDNCDSKAYEAFTKAHTVVAHNTEFNPPISDTAELYEETCKFLRRQAGQRWQGIFVIWDEFGTYLAGIARTPHSRESQRLQSFIEFCKRSRENQVHLVAIAHQSFEAYAGGESARQEFEKLHGRLMDSEYYLRAATDLYEMEEMTNSVIVQHAESQAWNEIRNHKDLDVLVDKVVDWDLYKGKDRTWVSNVIVRGCYPMHPIAMFCLPWLADRVGQETRSLFCFFGDAKNGGLMEFVRGREAVDRTSGRLRLYTVDLLANYFAPGIQNSSEYRRTAMAMNEALPQCGESELARRVVRTVAVLEIVDHSRLRPTEDVIADSLWLGNEERKELSGVLAELRDKGALKYRQSTKEYSLRSVAVGIDVEEAINQEVKRIADTFDLARALQEFDEIELSLTADKYNDRHFTNRPVDWQFVSASDLQHTFRPCDPNGCTVLYVLAKTEDEIKDAEHLLFELARKDDRLVVAIPKTPVTYTEQALRLKAIRNLMRQEPSSKPSSPEYDQELRELDNETLQQLKDDVRDWLAPEGFVWYNAGTVARQVKDLDGYLSDVLEHVFPRTPAIKDKAINHFAKKDSERKYRLEALDKILRSDGTFQIKKSGGTAVDRILRACVKETEIAEKRGESGDYETFALRAQPPVGSVLQHVWRVISNRVLARDGTVTLVSDVLKELREPPYGMTPQSIEMVLGSFLGTIIDGCELMRNSDYQEPSGATVHEMVENPNDWAIVYYVASDEDRQYVEEIRVVVGATQKPLGMSIWDAGKKALSDWFRNLPRVSRAGFGYPKDCEELCSNVVKLLSNPAAAVDARKFLKEELPRALFTDSLPEDSRFCETVEKLRIVVDRMSAFESTLERQLVERLCDIFGAAGRTENDLDEAVRRWFNNLSEFTRTHAFCGRQKALIDAASKSGTISERFFRSLATEMKLGRVEDWESNLSDEYVAAVKEAKREIEEYDPIGSKLGNESNEHLTNGGNDVVENAVAIIRKLIVEELRLDRVQVSELIQRLKEEFA